MTVNFVNWTKVSVLIRDKLNGVKAPFTQTQHSTMYHKAGFHVRLISCSIRSALHVASHRDIPIIVR
jgi:hypothetical protein